MCLPQNALRFSILMEMFGKVLARMRCPVRFPGSTQMSLTAETHIKLSERFGSITSLLNEVQERDLPNPGDGG